MRIFRPDAGDPMLLDASAAMQALAGELQAFRVGAALATEFPASVDGDPSPFSEFLPGLRVRKAVDAAPRLTIGTDRWLELTIAPEDLQRLCSKLVQLGDGGHTHLYAAPLSLILEADDSWPGAREA